jgi:peptidyl-prolyl cis-trans isomerase SurA
LTYEVMLKYHNGSLKYHGKFVLVLKDMLKIDKTISSKWSKAILMFYIFVICLVGGCEEKVKSTLSDEEYERIASAQEPERPDVLIVRGETLTYEEIIKSPANRDRPGVSLIESLNPIAKTNSLDDFKQLARAEVEEAVMSRVSNILLYQEAKQQLGENVDEALDKAAESELRKLILSFGGDEARAIEALRQRGMDRQKFKEQQKRLILTQSYVASKLPENRPITHGELVEHYNELKDEFFLTHPVLQFRLIDIHIARVDITNPGADQLEQARELAKELIRRIENGEDFGELAKKYSHGHRREFGGLWKPRDPESLAKPYDVLAVEAKKIKQGEVAGPIEAEGHIFIMKLEQRTDKGYEPLEKVQSQIEQKIILDRRREAINELNDKLIKQAAIGDTSCFIDSCLEKIYQMSE